MRKVVLAALLAVALVAPVFAADEGAMELDVKAGYNVMSRVDLDGWKTDIVPVFTVGADFFYYVMPELAIGAGINHAFDAGIKKAATRIGWTNFYVQAKYVFELGDDLFNNIYPLAQVGYGMLRLDPDRWQDSDGGLYWGIGAGTTIYKCVVLEILYSNANATVKMDWVHPGDLKYSTVQLKVGYKFTF